MLGLCRASLNHGATIRDRQAHHHRTFIPRSGFVLRPHCCRITVIIQTEVRPLGRGSIK